MNEELSIIRKTGFSGYFLIVWDIIAKARDMGISVGPGRGSAAGSLVSYLFGITDVDPIQYDLLFERFINPGAGERARTSTWMSATGGGMRCWTISPKPMGRTEWLLSPLLGPWRPRR